MPKVSIDTSLNTVQVVKSGNDLQKTMDKLGRSIEKTFDGRKASGLGDALKPLTQELAKIMTQAGDTAAQIKQMTSRTALAIQEVLKPSILIFDRMSPISSKARLMNIATLTSAAANGRYSKYLGALSDATKSSSNAPITKRAMIIGEFSFALASAYTMAVAAIPTAVIVCRREDFLKNVFILAPHSVSLRLEFLTTKNAAAASAIASTAISA